MTNNSLSGFDFIELCLDNGCRSIADIATKYSDLFSVSTLEKWHSGNRQPRLLTKIALYAIAHSEGWV